MTRSPIVSSQSRIRYPDHFEIGEGSILDDFCYISTRVRIGRFSHVAAGCTIAGGPKHRFSFGDFGSLASGTRVYCSSNDYVRDLVALAPPGVEPGAEGIHGDVAFGNYTGVGANSVVMPDNHIPEGAVIGALSFVPTRFEFEPWTVYAGCPVRPVRPRDRDAVMRQLDHITRQLDRLRDDTPADPDREVAGD